MNWQEIIDQDIPYFEHLKRPKLCPWILKIIKGIFQRGSTNFNFGFPFSVQWVEDEISSEPSISTVLGAHNVMFLFEHTHVSAPKRGEISDTSNTDTVQQHAKKGRIFGHGSKRVEGVEEVLVEDGDNAIEIGNASAAKANVGDLKMPEDCEVNMKTILLYC